MWRLLMAMALAAVVLSAIAASAALLKVDGGTLQVFTYPVDIEVTPPIDDCEDNDGDIESTAEDGENPGEDRPAEYEIRPGDTLTHIAARFGTTVEAVAQLNGLEDPSLIFYGWKLKLRHVGDEPAEGNESDPSPLRTEADSRSSEGELESDEAAFGDRARSHAAERAQPAAAEEPPSATPMRTVEYEVQPGDTLVDIAARFGTTVEAVAQLNGLEDPNLIPYGSTLNVPYVGEDAGGAPADVSR